MGYIDPDQLHGELDNLITFVGDNAAGLTAKGITPATIQAALTAIRNDLSTTKNARDKSKTALATTQQAFAASAATNYAGFSNTVDLVAGALGKQTPLGLQALNYRKQVTGSNQHASRTPTPTPRVEN